MAGSKTSLQQHLQSRHPWVEQCHWGAVEAQPGIPVSPACGAGCEAKNGIVRKFAPAAVAPAGAEFAEFADRRHAGEGQTDGGVNSGVPEPAVLLVVQRTGGWRGSLHMCTARARPQAKWQRSREPGRSEAPPETNLWEPPV